jgi:hypothetical protein
MADIDGIIGYNSPAGTNLLLAAYGNDIVNVATGLGYKLNLTAGNKAFFETFIDCVFLTNGVDKMRSLVGGAWSDSFSLPKQIIPKYIKKSVNNAQLLIGNVILTPGSGTALNYKSRVFKSSFPKLGKNLAGNAIGQSLQWGIESGKCNITQDTKKVTAIPDGNGRLPYFKSRGIKVGDPFFLLGGDIGQYTVASIPSEYEIILNETIPSATNTSVDFWVGSNWFDVGTDDNDEIKGFGENNSRDLIFKLFSLWYYTGSQLKPIKGAPGTSSQRSVINDNKGNTYYFHGSDLGITGIYKHDGVNTVKASRAIDPFIQGMSAANYSEVAAWQEGDELRFFLGDLTNTSKNISMTNAVATINTVTGAWDVSPIADVIKCATTYIASNVKNSYCGTNDSQVLKMGSGYSHNGTPIPAVLETGPRYPSGSELQNEMVAIQVVGENIRGLRISYKLWDKPVGNANDLKEYGNDDKWQPFGECVGDLTEFSLDRDNKRSAGIDFRVEEDGSLKNNWVLEKISLFYKPDRARLQ